MKKLILIPACIFSLVSSAQIWSLGIKGNGGTGIIDSRNLGQNLSAQKISRPGMERWEQTSSYGLDVGLGASVLYTFNDHFAILGELTWNALNSSMTFDYRRNLAGGGTGHITDVHSDIGIKLWYLSIPLMFKYTFIADKGFYGLCGAMVSVNRDPILKISERRHTDTYTGGQITGTTSEHKSGTTSLNVFNSSNVSFTVGFGYAFNINDRALLVDVRYHIPLTKSPMYTLDDGSANTFEENNVFTSSGRRQVETDAPSFKLDDYKTTTIDISIAWLFYNHASVSCFQAKKWCW